MRWEGAFISLSLSLIRQCVGLATDAYQLLSIQEADLYPLEVQPDDPKAPGVQPAPAKPPRDKSQSQPVRNEDKSVQTVEQVTLQEQRGTTENSAPLNKSDAGDSEKAGGEEAQATSLSEDGNGNKSRTWENEEPLMTGDIEKDHATPALTEGDGKPTSGSSLSRDDTEEVRR